MNLMGVVLMAAALLGPPGAEAGATSTGDRLSSPILLPGGMRFDVPKPADRPRRSGGVALVAALRYAPPGRQLPNVQFARYTSSSTHTASDGRVAAVFEQRPIWLVRYTSVPRRPASAVPPRQKHPPATTIPIVAVDVVIVVDDASGDVLLRSEMLAAPALEPGAYLL